MTQSAIGCMALSPSSLQPDRHQSKWQRPLEQNHITGLLMAFSLVHCLLRGESASLPDAGSLGMRQSKAPSLSWIAPREVVVHISPVSASASHMGQLCLKCWLGASVCVCVCSYESAVYTHVSMFVQVSILLCLCAYLSVDVFIQNNMHVSIFVCVLTCVYKCGCVHMKVYIHAHVSVGLYAVTSVCMSVSPGL